MTLFPKESIEELRRLIPYVREYQRLASTEGIDDIFQDNGGKLLQVLIVLGLDNLPGREGNDARDADGKEYELKSLNRNLVRGFSTHHHLNPVIIAKYCQVDWIFSVYNNIEIERIYLLTPAQMKPYFKYWGDKWELTRRDINNPKIPLAFVEKVGALIWKGPLVEIPPTEPLPQELFTQGDNYQS